MATKPKTISERLKEVQLFTGLSPEELAFVLDKKEQIYKMYLRGKFDHTYSIREDNLIMQLICLEELLEEKIALLENAKKLFKIYIHKKGRTETPYRKIWIKARIKFLEEELKNSVKKSVNLPSQNGRNHKEKVRNN